MVYSIAILLIFFLEKLNYSKTFMRPAAGRTTRNKGAGGRIGHT